MHEEVQNSWVDVTGAYPTLAVQYRKTLIELAKEELTQRSSRDCLAQTCLEKERVRQGRSVEAVAASLGCRPDLLTKLERNEESLVEKHHVELVAAWFHELGLDSATAGRTYRRSLRYCFPEQRSPWDSCRVPHRTREENSKLLARDQPDLEAQAKLVESLVAQMHEAEDRKELARLAPTGWARTVKRQDLPALQPFLKDVAWAVLDHR